MAEAPVDERISITVDGVEHRVPAGQNLLHACISAKLDLPYFCWHPALDSIGACRQCAVIQYQDADDQRGKLVMACMTPAQDGMRISIGEQRAETFRAQVIEWLMLNHPHDCPVCEEGGDCHLQDMTVMTGHSLRRATAPKKTWPNQDLGPCIGHEMNRCITCYRCVRFYRDYAGGTDLSAFASRDNVYFGRYESGTLESPFSGNLVEVCPTGVFTDKTFSAHYSRKWDLAQAPSVCSGCAVGCNIQPAERYGRLKRIVNRYHPEVNRYFLCDRGRFGYGVVNDAARLRLAGARAADGASFDPLSADQASDRLAEVLGAGPVAAVGSPRASLEANFVLLHLAQASGGTFSPGLGAHPHRLLRTLTALRGRGDLVNPTVAACEDADLVVVLGEDVQATAPILALALRQAARGRQYDNASDLGVPLWQDSSVRTAGRGMAHPLVMASPAPTGLDDIASTCHRSSPEALARSLADLRSGQPDDFGKALDAALEQAQRPLVVVGTGGDSVALLEQAAALAEERGAALALVAEEVNSLGVALLSGGGSDADGCCDLDTLLGRVADGSVATLLVLENDLYRHAPEDLVDRALAAAQQVVVLDCLETATAEHAHLVLPTASWAEAQGTVVNSEGRAQRQYPVLRPDEPVQPAWRWLAQAGALAGDNELATLDRTEQATAACAARVPALAGITDSAPPAAWRTPEGRRIARMSHRYSGRTAIHAHLSVHEPQPPADDDSPFSWSMEGSQHPRADLLVQNWTPGWNSSGQAITRFQEEVNGPLRGGNPGVRLFDRVPGGTTSAPGEAPVAELPDGHLRLVPRHELFGSEELSGRAAPVTARGPGPYALLHPDDAAALGVAAGGRLRVADSAPLPVRLDGGMARGCLAVPPGLPGIPAVPTGSVQPEVLEAGDGASDHDDATPAARPPGADIIARAGALLDLPDAPGEDS